MLDAASIDPMRDREGARARDDLAPLTPRSTSVEWRISDGPVDYPTAVAEMEAHARALADGRAPELVWLLEHPPLYTAGTSARETDLLEARLPVHRTRRGGQLTYHGPGQRVAYVMLDLNRRGRDVRRYVASLEAWLIATLEQFNVRGERRDDRVGVWVRRPEKAPVLIAGTPQPAEDKIAAIGVRVRRWVTLHGVSLNVEPDLDHFAGIIPCGVAGYGVTSLRDLGLTAEMADVDMALKGSFAEVFGG
jgi:lipoyl(octanoyl) transferase